MLAAELVIWPLLLAGLVLLGAATAAGLAARFAATDLAEPERRARALAMVVWATTVGAVAGPNLGEPAQRLAGPIGLAPLAGPFLCCAVVFTWPPLVTWTGLRPDPLLLAGARRGWSATARRATPGGARAALRAAPAARLGVAGIVLGHLVMVGLMSMTPVHMGHGGATLQLVGLVISLHVAGMYAAEPGVRLARRPGRAPRPVLGLGRCCWWRPVLVSSLAAGDQTALLERRPGAARAWAGRPGWSPGRRWSARRFRCRTGRPCRAWPTSR